MQKILAALSEPTRRAGLRLLWDSKEHCVCELMERLDASQSRMSRHMKALADAGLVTGRRDAQWVRYKRCPNIPSEVSAFIDALWTAEDAEQEKT
ncbi:metalloregulator ArsR/SmtB family transcription factor [Pseudovibrio sp. Tun.PSC04-5.I4]|uniref:ArsR/SmtB family transcription factor n=1 Tax=Pseudovibrio sp. Tun.PSC04-5.I4 TaxID=1798213 RepID=UPI000891EBD4|nr:metalloregulator ArsR/SmtB family transcription factor [Pseudovibrio sp. Tun.PSC04-5.I4]SDR48649.1 transcriptional regulator, ArsR family [Pseudovibrio sp. Tun.PSC04-5.I4]